MNSKEAAEQLRLLADKLDAVEVYTRHINVNLDFHFVSSLDDLRAIKKVAGEVSAFHSGGSHWIKGEPYQDVQVVAFYEAGLLGPVEKRVEKVVETEWEDADLSLLTVPE